MKKISFFEAKSTAASRAELRSNTGLTSRLRSFQRDEDGNMTILCVSIFVGIITVCGVGVDLMMNEMNRTKLQGTLDRAVLAAADLDQKRDPETVVRDYFKAANLSDALLTVKKERTANYSTVSATARLETDPLFTGVLGVQKLKAPAAGEAEERVGNVEVSLVLDISGSMGWDSAEPNESKLEVMQDAAHDFLDLVLDPANGGITTVNLVSYNHTVNLGSTLAGYYNLDQNHTLSNCVRFADSDFDDTAISRTDTLDRLSHFDIWSDNWYSTEIGRPMCPTDNFAEIKVHQTDKEALKDYIDDLDSGGNTAIDLGMKWGLALLDPDSEDLVTDMITDQHVPAIAESRPAEWDDHEAMKIVVLMTDGENTTQYDLYEDMQTGMSNIWIDDRGNNNPSDDRFSVSLHNNFGSSSTNTTFFWERYRDSSKSSRYRWGPDGGGNARQMSKEEVYSRWDEDAIEDRFIDRPYSDKKISWSQWNIWGREKEKIVVSEDADERLARLCDEARSSSIFVYTVAFEAPENGVAAMQQCASTAGHFFDVEGAELSEAFEVIASTINQLRLTQ